MSAKLEIYKDKLGDLRWKLIHTSGQVVASYKAKANTMGSMNFVKEHIPNTPIEDEDKAA
jgi:uncharacterized protein YegP (UPF0339 family)